MLCRTFIRQDLCTWTSNDNNRPASVAFKSDVPKILDELKSTVADVEHSLLREEMQCVDVGRFPLSNRFKLHLSVKE